MKLYRHDGPEEKLSRKIIAKLWPEIKFVEPGSSIDLQGIDGYYKGKPIQHKYDRTIPRYNRLWDEHLEKEKFRPDKGWVKCKRIAEIYIFTTGGNINKQDEAGSTAYWVERKILDEYEIGKDIIINTNKTSAGYFVPIRKIYLDIIIKKIPKILDWHFTLPLNDWPYDEYVKECHAIANNQENWLDKYLKENHDNRHSQKRNTTYRHESADSLR